jgi:ankyrin repeat protein
LRVPPSQTPKIISSYTQLPHHGAAHAHLLLNLIDTRPQAILSSLAQHPQLAAARDAHGYSLVHAAASYGQLGVLRDLVQKYSADVNILDEDGETPLFATENVDVAKCLVEELGADTTLRNEEGKTAEEKIAEEEGEAHEVFQYLKSLRTGAEPVSAGAVETADVHPPPPLPDGVNVEMGTMAEDEAGDAPDPEIRRRIEELAARPDYESEEVQSQLRELVTEVLSGMGGEDGRSNVRRRVD